MSDDHQQQANIGVVGLAVMGSNLARNLASREGNTVAVFNRTQARTDDLVREHADAGFVASETIEDFAASWPSRVRRSSWCRPARARTP